MDGRDKPERLKEGHLDFLDALRGSGVTNMFGARPYLNRKFPTLSKKEAEEILNYWMITFSERHAE
jgi:hypothetical protein